MILYYDTGVLLKLYTAEPESEAVAAFVRGRRERLCVTDLHLAECFSALRLKVFRRECSARQASAAIELIKEDVKTGVLTMVAPDWGEAWALCHLLADRNGAVTGARTLDTLHVAAAQVLEARELVTSDQRQAHLARLVGLPVIDPTGERGGGGAKCKA